MGYKSGTELIFLSDERSITRRRVWVARIIVFMIWLTPASTGQISIPYAIGRFIGLLVIYWLALRLLSRSTDDIEYEETLDADSKLIDVLNNEEIATRRQLVQAALSKSDYDDKDKCWSELVKPFLEEHENVKQLDDSGRRWQFES